jgi:hypothetical protein
MGVVGNKPDAELEDLLGFVEEVPDGSRASRSGTERLGGSICEVGDKLLAASPHKAYTHFMAHGMGLVSHEAPRAYGRRSSALPRLRHRPPLEAGMVCRSRPR